MKQPNILFIMMDDMGWRDLTCYGSTFYETPNIDALAKDGLLFSNAYASCPVCSPSRASFLTGKYPARLNITQYIGGHTQGKLLEVPYLDHLPLEEYALPKALKQGGYNTWHIGKWHLGEKEFYPEHHGFDCNIGGCDWGHPHDGYFSPWGIETLPEGKDGDYLTDRLTDEAIQLITQKDDKPFFMYFSHYAVHTPIEAKPEDIARFTAKAKRMNIDGIDPFVKGEYCPAEHIRHEQVTRRVIQSDATYAALIYNLDQNVGRLIDALKQQGLYDDTIIFFTSDNGGLATAEGSPTCNAPLSEGKGWMADGGIREPLIIKAAELTTPGTQTDALTTTTDFYPTILELAGLPLIPCQHCDGISLLPVLSGKGELVREAIYWHYPHYANQGSAPAAAVRSGDYKLVRHFEDDHIELYNLAQDPSETFDLSQQEPALAAHLHQLLCDWLVEVDGAMPVPNPNYLAE